MANVITSPPERLENLLARQEAHATPNPGYDFSSVFPSLSAPTNPRAAQTEPEAHRQAMIRVATVCAATILAHLAVVVGMVWIGFRHFGNIRTGIAAAALYMLTFYISQFTSRLDHVLPAMLLVWAVAAYRRPTIAGILLGLAGGVSYYPLFLLPLWCGFYWRRGLVRFLIGVVFILAVLVTALALSAPDTAAFIAQAEQMFGLRNPLQVTAAGFWQYYHQAYRYPVLAAFGALFLSLALWPAQKNLGTLLSCSAAVMLAAQFWLSNQGGLFMAWYLPLLILTVFRPNLEDRVALSAVKPVWRRK
jgi:hypothetical protein